MLEEEWRRGAASRNVCGATSNAISDTGGNGAWRPIGKSNDHDCCPTVQHAVRETRPSAISLQHGSFPPEVDDVAAQTPRLMLVSSTRSTQLARRRRRPDICSLWSAPTPKGKFGTCQVGTCRRTG